MFSMPKIHILSFARQIGPYLVVSRLMLYHMPIMCRRVNVRCVVTYILFSRKNSSQFFGGKMDVQVCTSRDGGG